MDKLTGRKQYMTDKDDGPAILVLIYSDGNLFDIVEYNPTKLDHVSCVAGIIKDVEVRFNTTITWF